MNDARTGDAVVGAGMLGLVLALRLAQAGRRVTLFEAAPQPGGLIEPNEWATPSGEVVRWDRYYHVIAGGDRALLALLDELGLADEVRWRRTRTLFYDGRGLHPLNNALDFLRLPTLGLVDKLRLARTIVGAARIGDGLPLEALSAQVWLTRMGGARNWQRLWQPLLRAKLGDNSRFASAAYVWSVIRRFYGAREGAARTERFGFVEGGYRRVVLQLVTRLVSLGVELRLGTPVQSIAPLAGGRGLDLRAGGQTHPFERVLLTCAGPLAAQVAAGAPQAERERWRALRYQGVVCTSLLLARPLGGAYLTYVTDPALPFTAVIEMSSLVPPQRFGGAHLVYLPCYLPSEHPDFERDDRHWIERKLAGLRRLYPDLRDDQVLARSVSRARHVLALATQGYSAALPASASALPGLHVINSAQIVNAALSVDDTVRLAERSVAPLLAPAR